MPVTAVRRTSPDDGPVLIEGLGERIKRVRTREGLSAEAFAQRIGVHRNSVVRYESSEAVPGADVIAKIYKEFAAPPAWLLCGDGPPNTFFLTRTKDDVPPDSHPGQVYRLLRTWQDRGMPTHHSVMAIREDWLRSLTGLDYADAGIAVMRDDSMAPTIRRGDRVVFVRGGKDTHGDGLFVFGHAARVRMFVRRVHTLSTGDLRITCDNELHNADSEVVEKLPETAKRVVLVIREVGDSDFTSEYLRQTGFYQPPA